MWQVLNWSWNACMSSSGNPTGRRALRYTSPRAAPTWSHLIFLSCHPWWSTPKPLAAKLLSPASSLLDVSWQNGSSLAVFQDVHSTQEQLMQFYCAKMLYPLSNPMSLSVFISYCCHNKLHKQWLKTTQKPHSSVGQKSSTDFTVLKCRCQQGCVPFWRL